MILNLFKQAVKKYHSHKITENYLIKNGFLLKNNAELWDKNFDPLNETLINSTTEYFAWGIHNDNDIPIFKNTAQKIFAQIKSLDDFAINSFCTTKKINEIIITIGKNQDDADPEWFKDFRNQFTEALFLKLSESPKFKTAVEGQYKGLTALHFAAISNLTPAASFLKVNYFSEDVPVIKKEHILDNIREWNPTIRLKLSLHSQETINFDEFVSILKTNGNIKPETLIVLEHLTLNNNIPLTEKTFTKKNKI